MGTCHQPFEKVKILKNFVTKKNILLNKEFKELLKKCIILLENLDLWESIKIEDLIKNFINTNKIKFSKTWFIDHLAYLK